MRLYIVEPRDTALFRDARPFAGNAPAVSMPTPWPSTLAGLFRTLDGQDEAGRWTGNAEDARKLEVAGPLLVRLGAQDEIADFYFPAPADAVFFKVEGKEKLKVHRLHPSADEGGFCSDLPEGLLPTVFSSTENPGKAASGPKWWKAGKFFEWLQGNVEDGLECTSSEFGITLPDSEERVHVGIDSDTLTAEDGNLFMTHMRRFTARVGNEFQRFALLAWTTADLSQKLATFGGERRLSRVVPVQTALPKPPEPVGNRLRVVLLTPGLFADGWRPSTQLGGAKLVAACVGRPSSVSGWDYDKGGPKASRRLTPAGSVYWLEFSNAEEATKWASENQYQSIADGEQDRRDGFGIIIIGRG